MVLFQFPRDIFPHHFTIVTKSIYNQEFNRANVSQDMLHFKISEDGNKLYTTRLIRKETKIPRWISYLCGKGRFKPLNLQSWIIEYCVVDRFEMVMKTYIKNIEYLNWLNMQELSVYRYNKLLKLTEVDSQIRLMIYGVHHRIKGKIEQFAVDKFHESMIKSRNKMKSLLNRPSII